ncbi:MAG: hypothetical protein Q8Q59_11555 [Luteolibacter sp.]|jgi:hypothetical protein|nr:hypothetical protein [Luteolibacter sp.]
MRSILFSLTLLLPTMVSGQDARAVRCRFISFGGSDDSATVLTLSAKGTELTCPLSNSSISAPIACSATNNIIAFLTPDKRKPAATATIPPQASAVILMFVRSGANPEVSANALQWKILVIEDSPKNFPDGGAFVANFHNKDIRFVIGESKVMLTPGRTHGVPMPKERDDFNMAPVVFQFQQDATTWRTVKNSVLRFIPAMRYLIVAYVDPASGRPQIATYKD